MSINLWKLAGKPTSYNPLPTNNTAIVGITIGEWILKFKAKSLSGTSSFRVGDSGLQGVNQVITPSTDFKEYSIPISRKTLSGSNILYLGLDNTFTDIEVKDIELVQKPLPRLTINGIDEFTSGKWNLHANARVIDDETLELNATGNYQGSDITCDVLPNQDYYLALEGYFNSSVKLVWLNGSTPISTLYPVLPTSFKSPVNANKVQITLQNVTSSGKFTFKRPMLNVGSIPAPYQKKRGDKMVMPVAKKNLAGAEILVRQGFSATYTISGSRITSNSANNNIIGYVMPVTQGKTYRITVKSNLGTGGIRVYGYGTKPLYSYSDGTSNNFYSFGVSSLSLSITIPNGVNWLVVGLHDSGNMDAYIEDVMVEEGTTATPYEPYAVQINKRPKRYVPKKNLFDGGSWIQNGANFVKKVDLIPVKPNTTYTISVISGATVGFNTKDTGKNQVAWFGYTNQRTFTTDSNTYYLEVYANSNGLLASDVISIKPQLEEGSTPTPYEPYAQVLPRAKTGLTFNGTSDYLQLPSMTMDSIEMECLIDSAQAPGSTTPFIFDARNGLTNGYFSGALGFGWDKLIVDNVEKPTRSYSDVPKGQRVKIKAIRSASFTDDVTVFGNNSANNGNMMKGILYKVTCYLSGAIVAQYDFENPNNIVGDKVLPSAKNLIPSFEDSRWSLHPNFKVLGKDVGRLDANATFQSSFIEFDVIPNTNYLVMMSGNGSYAVGDITGSVSGLLGYGTGTRTVNSGNRTKLRMFLSNLSVNSFDFIKPQLYELSGKEGTVVGKPIPLKKAAKRSLYRKR